MSSFRDEVDYDYCCEHFPWRTCLVLRMATSVGVLMAAFANVRPVHVAVQDASLARLALAGPNGTSVAYNVSFAVALHNLNWAMCAVLRADDAELLFAGQHLASVRVQGNIRPGKTEVCNVVAAGEGAAPLGSAGVAELVKETVAGGVFRLQLKLAGEVRYPLHRTRRLEATCPLELPLASSKVQARFNKVKCVV